MEVTLLKRISEQLGEGTSLANMLAIQKFSGKRSDVDFATWIKTYMNLARTRGWTEKQKKLNLYSHVSGRARRFLDDLVIDPVDKKGVQIETPFTDIVKSFRDHFEPESWLLLRESTFTTLTQEQDESVDDFSDRVDALGSQLKKTDRDRMLIFMNGLRGELAQHVLSMRPVDFTDAVEHARTAELLKTRLKSTVKIAQVQTRSTDNTEFMTEMRTMFEQIMKDQGAQRTQYQDNCDRAPRPRSIPPPQPRYQPSYNTGTRGYQPRGDAPPRGQGNNYYPPRTQWNNDYPPQAQGNYGYQPRGDRNYQPRPQQYQQQRSLDGQGRCDRCGAYGHFWRSCPTYRNTGPKYGQAPTRSNQPTGNDTRPQYTGARLRGVSMNEGPENLPHQYGV